MRGYTAKVGLRKPEWECLNCWAECVICTHPTRARLERWYRQNQPLTPERLAEFEEQMRIAATIDLPRASARCSVCQDWAQPCLPCMESAEAHRRIQAWEAAQARVASIPESHRVRRTEMRRQTGEAMAKRRAAGAATMPLDVDLLAELDDPHDHCGPECCG